MKVLILLPYYNRPVMVRNALTSIARQTSHDWHLAFIDDGSRVAGEPIVRDILSASMPQVTLYHTEAPVDPVARGHTVHGAYMNRAIREIPADVVIILCDDDALCDDYVENLSRWFAEHPDDWSCYSNVRIFDPFAGPPWTAPAWPEPHPLNRHTGAIECSCAVDASQVAWRRRVHFMWNDVWFIEVGSKNLDADFFVRLNRRTGPTKPSGFVGQYKGWHHAQLGTRSHAWAEAGDGVDLRV